MHQISSQMLCVITKATEIQLKRIQLSNQPVLKSHARQWT